MKKLLSPFTFLALLMFAGANGMELEEVPLAPSSPFPKMYAQAIEPLRARQPGEAPTSYLQYLPKDIFDLLKHYLSQASNFDEAIAMARGLLRTPMYKDRAQEIIDFLKTEFPDKNAVDIVAALDIEAITQNFVEQFIQQSKIKDPYEMAKYDAQHEQIYDWATTILFTWASGNEDEKMTRGQMRLFIAIVDNKYLQTRGFNLNDLLERRPFDYHGESAFELAVFNNNTAVTKLLLALKADPNSQALIMQPSHFYQKMIVIPLYIIVAKSENHKSVEILKAFINAGLDLNKVDTYRIDGQPVSYGKPIGHYLLDLFSKKLAESHFSQEAQIWQKKLAIVQDAMKDESTLGQIKDWLGK